MHSLDVQATEASGPLRTKRSERSTDLVYKRLKQRILDNEYAPGTQVLEQDLASDLGLSRTPVREALIRLQQEGLVEVVPRHGMRVLPLSPRDMREIYTVLTSLEPTAAELLAARRPSAEEIAPLVDACATMEAALASGDRLAWAKADEKFHRMLVELCGNRRLASMVMTVWEQSHRARMFTLKLRPLPVESTREHRAALDAILAGDAARARDIYRAHRERARDTLMAIIEQYGLSQL
jgi:DNA-binding GntR family transcriptional regulator